MDKNKLVAVSLLDLSKAFDSINHDHYKTKLKDLGYSTTALYTIHSFMSNRQQKTLVNNTEPDWTSIHQGVPQGTILRS